MHCKAAALQKPSSNAGHFAVQASGNVSQLEAQVAGLQQSLLEAKDLTRVKLQEAVAARHQANTQIKVSSIARIV